MLLHLFVILLKELSGIIQLFTPAPHTCTKQYFIKNRNWLAARILRKGKQNGCPAKLGQETVAVAHKESKWDSHYEGNSGCDYEFQDAQDVQDALALLEHAHPPDQVKAAAAQVLTQTATCEHPPPKDQS